MHEYIWSVLLYSRETRTIGKYERDGLAWAEVVDIPLHIFLGKAKKFAFKNMICTIFTSSYENILGEGLL